MARSVRFVPEGGALVEVTVRTRQSRLLLRPSPVLNEIVVIGVLGRAQKRYGLLCCGVVFVSTHWHALLWVEDAEQLARFSGGRDAAEQLKAGDRSARFPMGSFPPGLPFVRALPP
jgi:hypothetical protein